ncbi:hypothetical protein GCM10023083_54220 [Streptomyces phyllanthi]
MLVTVRIADLPGDDKAPGRTAWRALRDGPRHIRGHRVLAPLILAVALGDLGFVGPLNVGLVLLADERGRGASGVGWVLAGFGTGAGAAALLLTVRGRLPHAAHVAAYTARHARVRRGSQGVGHRPRLRGQRGPVRPRRGPGAVRP